MKTFRNGLMTFVLLLLVSGGALAQTSDVPADHWAYDAVRSLLDRGYLNAEADGLFYGDDPVSRYDLAGVVARLLDDIEEGRVQIGTAADVDMLRRLESEFRAELVQWHDARQELEAAHGQTQRQVAVIDEQLNNILFELELIDAELAVLSERADGHDGDVEALTTRLAELAAELSAARNELRTAIGELTSTVTNAFAEHGISIDAQFAEQMSAYARLEEQLATLEQRIDNELVPLHNRLSENSAALFMRLGEMDAAFAEKWNEFDAELKSVREATSDLDAALKQLGVEIAGEMSRVDGDTERLESALDELKAELETIRAVAAGDGEALRLNLNEQRQALQELFTALTDLEQRFTDGGERRDNDVAELRAIVAFLAEGLEKLEQKLNETAEVQENLRNDLRVVERHTVTLTDAVMVLDETAAQLRADVDGLSRRLDDENRQLRGELTAVRGQLDAVQGELNALQGVLGTSEEQIAALTERVRRDLDEQLALTLAREGQLSRQLAELQAEFASYRDKTEQELQSARSMGNIGIGAAILAVVLGLAR